MSVTDIPLERKRDFTKPPNWLTAFVVLTITRTSTVSYTHLTLPTKA